MGKKFKPFDKVLVREGKQWPWRATFYSHYNPITYHHYTTSGAPINEILHYEGNEHLVGLVDEPDEEVMLEEGEYIMVGNITNSILPEDWYIREFHGVNSQGQIKIYNNSSCEFHHWKYAIRFKDFDPSNMEETLKHILCVKNGKIIKYKN